MITVPKIPLQEPPEYVRTPIPEGKYKAKIIDVTEPKPTLSRDYIFRTSFVLKIQQEEGPRKVWAFYAGYAPTISMIWCNRKLWIGTEVDVQIRIKQHDERLYNDAYIIWPEETLIHDHCDI